MNLHIRYDQDQALWQLSSDSGILLEYIHGEADDPNPSFRQVKTPEGHAIALYRPWDHPWHPGLFFSWKYLNGLNFWESMHAGQRNVAVTERFLPVEGREPGFRQRIAYVTHMGEALLREERTVSVVPLPESDGYLIRWHSEFAPVSGDVTLDRTEATEQSPWGGYAGLSCRMARNYLGPDITTDEGALRAEEAHGRPFRWCDYSGKLDGYLEKRRAGVCLMDAPGNPRHPTRMLTYDYKDMQFLHAAFLYGEPYTLRAGETLTLDYGIFVHDGGAVPATLERIYREAFN
ncbi:MAG: PmoA family protein [Cohnella sp.]|nr:PmoA family protein [Cohnella sp.]